jgi:hypothetical protein
MTNLVSSNNNNNNNNTFVFLYGRYRTCYETLTTKCESGLYM